MKKEVRNYKISMMRDEFIEKTMNPDYMNLSDEIALTRVLVQDLWNSSASKEQLVGAMPIFLDSFIKLEKLIGTAHKIDKANENSISEAQLGAFCANIIDIIAKHVDDPLKIGDISGDILKLLGDANGSSTGEFSESD